MHIDNTPPFANYETFLNTAGTNSLFLWTAVNCCHYNVMKPPLRKVQVNPELYKFLRSKQSSRSNH